MNSESQIVAAQVDAHENAFLSPCCEADRTDGICSSCKRTQWEMALYQEAKLDLLMKQQTKETQELHGDIDAHLRKTHTQKTECDVASGTGEAESDLRGERRHSLRDLSRNVRSLIRPSAETPIHNEH